jgi:hypothetical protein
MSEPPKVPPVALGLFDEDDYIRHLGDQIAELSATQASSLLQYLERPDGIS